MKLRAIELFAGVGGFRLGLEAAGHEVLWSNQWEPGKRVQHASDCYVRHFGDDAHVNDDIAMVAAEEVPDHDVLVGGFPCFVAGTMILTRRGYVPIEEVTTDDVVLTHLGRWRRVTATMSRDGAALLRLQAGGVPELTTTYEHPFFARERGPRGWDHEDRYRRTFGLPTWVAAEKLAPGVHFLSQVLPEVEADDLDPQLWWVIGRYLADGWRTVNNGKGRVVICCAHDEADDLGARLRVAGFAASRAEEASVVKFHITRKWFYDLLEPFGRYAEGKRLPAHALCLDEERSGALLDGYLSGDGSRVKVGRHGDQTLDKAGSVSKALALSIALVAQRARGVIAGVHYIVNKRGSVTIEGREVKERPYWQVHIPGHNRSAFVEGRYAWKQLRRVEPAGVGRVYNITVEEDESYVADGAIVHNCQDYSVATTKAQGIAGKKGVLWWEIERLAREKRPSYLLLENVDRLLRSPTAQRGRDFGIVLRCLADLGYRVEWRALNAADHGFPQKRRRTFIFAAHERTAWGAHIAAAAPRPPFFARDGFFAKPFPVREEAVVDDAPREPDLKLPRGVQRVSDSFEARFWNAGLMIDGDVWTQPVSAQPAELAPLRSVLQQDIDPRYFIPDALVPRWKYLKGAKAEKRMTAEGFEYSYTEGGIPFPDHLDQPSRTLLTGEGGTSPSRFKHIIQDPQNGRFRVLTPVECERLNGFPDNWTEGMPERWRYFTMGNALVVGLVERMARRLAEPVTPGASPPRSRAPRSRAP